MLGEAKSYASTAKKKLYKISKKLLKNKKIFFATILLNQVNKSSNFHIERILKQILNF